MTEKHPLIPRNGREFIDWLASFETSKSAKWNLLKKYVVADSRTFDLLDTHPTGKAWCSYCIRPLNDDEIAIDHVIPRCQGGQDVAENLVVSCRECNSAKGGRTPREWAKSLREKGERLPHGLEAMGVADAPPFTRCSEDL